MYPHTFVGLGAKVLLLEAFGEGSRSSAGAKSSGLWGNPVVLKCLV